MSSSSSQDCNGRRPKRLLNSIISELLSHPISSFNVLNEEQDGFIVVSWNKETECQIHTEIGIYHPITNRVEILRTFQEVVNIVQATINKTKTVLAYVQKEESDSSVDQTCSHKLYVTEVKNLHCGNEWEAYSQNSSPMKAQFLYKKKPIPFESERCREQLVVFVFKESISLCNINVKKSDNGIWMLLGQPVMETILRDYLWAQWDVTHQQLHYVHYRELHPSVEEEDERQMHAMLSCLQFHDDMPHETVLNIPLHMPELPVSVESQLESDNIPLRLSDGLLNLSVLSDTTGLVCICHHYLYQASRVLLPADIKQCESQVNSVYFAYSVTLLHHSCVIHVVIPGISLVQAKGTRISFTLYGDHHLLVVAPRLFVHLLDIGLSHEPCHHILLSPLKLIPFESLRLAPLSMPRHVRKSLFLDLDTLEFVEVKFTKENLVEALGSTSPLLSTLATLHYFLFHLGDLEGAKEVLGLVCENPLNLDIPKVFQEFLMSAAYSGARKNLPSDAAQLLCLLPFTTVSSTNNTEVKVGEQNARLVRTSVGNVATMLLSPQQRLVRCHSDTWTRLWDHIQKMGKDRPRFKSSQVAEKLMVSLLCYQPEALSRASTPMSPTSPLICTGTMADITGILSRKGPDVLPFQEVESCTASKQEYVISVNLRELSMHLLKNNTRESPMHVHAVATKYVGAQLEMSRLLCHLVCLLGGVDPDRESERGFRLIDQLEQDSRRLLFTLLERYYLSVEELGFPLPQGFSSFFAYLGYRVLPFPFFTQYIQKGVLDLQVDVVKLIMADLGDATDLKLQLVSLLPRTRAKRILNQWAHPRSLMLRAREHALNILSGVGGREPPGRTLLHRKPEGRGLAAYPSADRLSPLDTFLNLLTAKASLTELDLGLLVEATVSSTEDSVATS